jgi:hypothetical protein
VTIPKNVDVTVTARDDEETAVSVHLSAMITIPVSVLERLGVLPIADGHPPPPPPDQAAAEGHPPPPPPDESRS